MNRITTLIFTFIALASISAIAATPTLPTANAKSVSVDANAVLLSPTTFFSANTQSLASALQPSSDRRIYVSKTGSDSTGSFGSNLPFATIAAALNVAQNNCEVIILPGTYAVTPVLKIDSETTAANLSTLPMLVANKTNVTIRGYGATVTGSGTGTILGLINCNNVTVQGLEFSLTKGLGSGVTSITATIQGFGTNANITLDGVRILSATDQGVYLNRLSYGCTIRNSYFYNVGVTNVAYVSGAVPSPFVDGTAVGGFGSSTIVENNIFESCFRCVEWDEYSGATPVHQGLIVRGNVISNCLHTAIFTYSGNVNSCNLSGITIADNYVHMSTGSSRVTSAVNSLLEQSGILIGLGKQVQISGNTVVNAYDYGITALSSSHVEALSIVGNTVYGITNVPACRGIVLRHQSGGSTWTYQLMRVVVANNLVSETGANGYSFSGDDVQVVGNDCENCGLDNTTQRYVYFVESGAYPTRGVVFTGNTSFDVKGSSLSFLIGVQTGAQKIYIGRDNIGRNVVNKGAGTTAPVSVNSGSYSETYLDGMSGSATLVAGTVTVAFPVLRSTSQIMLTRATTGGTVGHLSYTITAGTSFTINSSSASDTSTINWVIIEPFF